MSVSDIHSSDEFKKLIKESSTNNGTIVTMFGAKWCAACKMITYISFLIIYIQVLGIGLFNRSNRSLNFFVAQIILTILFGSVLLKLFYFGPSLKKITL
jgi:hypothetical protein